MQRFVVLAAAGLALAAIGTPGAAQSANDQRVAAQVAYVAGDFARAEEILAHLTTEQPGDADLLRRLAAVQAARGDLYRASRTIDRAMAIAPADFDIQLARANILLWRGQHREARRQADAIVLTRPDYPGLSDTIAAIGRAENADGVRLFAAGIGGSISHVRFPGSDSQTWGVASGSVVASLGSQVRAAFDVEREERTAVDTRLSARIDLLHPGGNVYLFGSATPNADFRESWSVGAGGERAIDPRTTVLLDARYASYRFDDVGVLGVGLRQQLGPNVSATVRTINLFGGGEDYRFGGSLRLDYAPEGQTGWFVGAASYPDTEDGNTAQVRALSAGTGIPVDKRLTLRLAAEYEKREHSYQRSIFALGLGWRFGTR